MNRLLQLCLLILLSISGLKAQTLSVTDVNTQNYPNAVSAGFWVIGADGRPITNLTAANFSVTVNGQPRQVISAGCGTSIPNPDSMSAVLTIDISSSMVALAGGISRLNIAKNAANMFINNLPLGISEAAITSFNHNSFVNQDLTVMRPWLTSAINNLTPVGNTSYNEAFLNANSGALNIAAGGSRSKKVIIFLTDGNPTETVNVQQITTLANADSIDIYCLCLGMAAPQSLKDIANGTGGRCFENINSLDDIRNAYSYILMYSQGYGEACGITWRDSITCSEARTATIQLLSPFTATTTVSYSQPQGLVPHLNFTSSSNINFGCVTSGNAKDTVLTLVASGSNVTINGASSNNTRFTIIPPPTYPVVLRQGIDTLKVRVRYTSTDSTAKTAIISFSNNSCDNPTATITTGCTPDIIFQEEEGESLKLIFPNGTENLINCTDTTIRWTGVPPETRVVLEYNINNSNDWINIDSNATGLAYRWRVPNIQGNQFKMRVRVYDSLWIDGSDTSYILGNSTFTCIDWNPARTKIAAGTYDGKIVIMDKLTGAIENSWQVRPNYYDVQYIDWSPTDETKIAFYDNSGGIIFLNPITGDVSPALPGTQYHSLFKWSNDGTRLAAVWTQNSTERTVKIFNSNGVALNPLSEQTADICSIAWSADDTRFAVATFDSTLYVYNMTSTNPTVNWAFTGTMIFGALAFNPLNADTIAASSYYNNPSEYLKIYRKNNNSADLVRTITGIGSQGSLQWSPSGERLICGQLGHTYMYNLYTDSIESYINRYSKWYSWLGLQGYLRNNILYNEGLNELIGAFEHEGIITYNTNTGAIVNSIHTLNGVASSVSFSPDHTKLAVTNANIIRIWDVTSRTLDRVITNNTDIITGMQWNPVANKIAAASNFNFVKIWNPLTGALEVTISGLASNSGRNNKEQQIAWNPNGSKLAVTRSGFIDVYDTTNWNVRVAQYPTNLDITSLTWSPDNVNILVGVNYNDLRTLNTSTNAWTTYNSGQTWNDGNYSHPSWNASGDRFVYVGVNSWQNYLQVYNQNNSNSPIVSITPNNWILSLDWHKSRNKIATGTHNTGGFDIYSGRNYRLIKSFTDGYSYGNLGSTMSAKWCQDSSKLLLATGHLYGTVGLHYLPSVQEIIADTSDQFWSILKPLVAGKNIDMGNVAVGTTRDSTIIPYLTNNSGLPVDVDTIIITGADASSFSISPEFVACTIPNGGTKDLEVHFTPTSTGTKTAQIKVIVRCDTLTYTITGNGVIQTIFSFYNIIDFGRVRVGVCKDSAAYLVKNTGSSSVSITSKTMMGPDNIQFLKKGPAVPFTLAPNQLHKDTVSFKPNRIGKSSSQIGCGYNGIGSPAITILLGEGYGMPLIFGIDSCKFADITCSHEAKDTTIYIENVGDTVLTVNSTTLIGANAGSFSFVRSLNNALIQPNKRDSVIVRFNAYQYGTKLARLSVASNSEWKDSVKYIDIRAKRDNSALELIGAFVNFGRVGTSTTVTKTFKIVNKGNQALTWSTPIDLGAFTITNISQNPLPNYNDTATVTVRLITNSTPNQYYDNTYTFTDACGRTSTARFLANDTTAAPEITVINNINIPAIICENYKDTTLTITNSGTANLIVNSAIFSGSNSGEFGFNPPSFTPLTILPGASSNLTVRFSPNSTGTKSATLTLKSNASNVIDSISIINLTAIKDSIGFQVLTGTTVLNTGDTLRFLPVCPGTAIDTLIKIKNLSSIATNIAFNGVSSPFSIVGTNPFNSAFAVNETKDLRVRFESLNNGIFTADLIITDSCGRVKKIVLKVKQSNPTINMSDSVSICSGASIQLTPTITGGTAPYTYSWSPKIAMDDSTSASPRVNPTDTTSYILRVTDNIGCMAYDTITVKVKPLPNIGTISGAGSICVNSDIDLDNETPDGVWSSSNNSIATVNNVGLVHGVAEGRVKIKYTVSNECGSTSDSVEINVEQSIGKVKSIIGDTLLCQNQMVVLSDSSAGGTWRSSDTNIIKIERRISGSGIDSCIARGVGSGIAYVYYTISHTCAGIVQSDSTRHKLEVLSLPTIVAITGIKSVCITQTTQLSNSTPNGTWSISPTSVATISSTGLVTGISAGTATVHYTVTNASGCLNSVSYPITVNALPNPKISGDSLVCIGSPLTYSTAVAMNTIYTWQVKRGIVISGAGSESISLRWDSAGMDTLSLIATDTLSHCSNTVQMYIRINPSLQISFASVRSICKGDSVHLYSQVSGGTASYTYEWTARNGTALTDNNKDSLVVYPTETTIYDLVVTDSKQCTATASVEVKVHKYVSITLPGTLTFDKLPTGQSNSDTSFVFTNNGTDTITIDNLSINPPFKITLPKTPITVQPGANITINITFNPQAAGTYTQVLTIKGSPCDWVRTVIINAKADTLLFTQDISYVDFGKFKTCTSVDLDTVITIKNTGTSDMIIDFANSNSISPFSMPNNTDTKTLKPNDSIKIKVSYNPSIPGTYSESLKIPYQAGSVKDSIEIDLNGAFILPQLSLNTKLMDLGNILACDTNPIDTSFTLSNISAINIDSVNVESLNSLFQSDAGSYFVIAENGNKTIKLNANLSNLPYAPFSDSIVVHYDCDNTDTLVIIGHKQQVSYSATDSLKFGRYVFCDDTQSKSDSLSIAINNNSSSGVVGKVSDIRFVKNYFKTNLKVGNSVLSGNNEYQVYLNIDAGLPDGKYSDTLQLHILTSPCDTVFNIPLYFEKVSEKLTFIDSLNFNSTVIDTFKTDSITITNNGSGAATIDTIAGLVAPFEVVSTNPKLPATLAPNGTLKVNVKYSPTTLGTHSQMLNFSTTDTTCHRNIAIKLSGQSNSKLIAKYHIALDTVTVPVGSPATLHLKLLSSENLITDGVDKIYRIKLSFNSTLLMPEFNCDSSKFKSILPRFRTIEIEGITQKPSGLLRELRFKSGLGNNTQTEVIIESVEWYDTELPIISIIDTGLVKLTNLCHEGGTRLINPSNPILINNIRPNPATSGEVIIDFTITEKGATELRLVNSSGELIKSIPINTETVGKKTETILLGDIPSGTYYITLKTPTWEDTQIMKVVK